MSPVMTAVLSLKGTIFTRRLEMDFEPSIQRPFLCWFTRTSPHTQKRKTNSRMVASAQNSSVCTIRWRSSCSCMTLRHLKAKTRRLEDSSQPEPIATCSTGADSLGVKERCTPHTLMDPLWIVSDRWSLTSSAPGKQGKKIIIKLAAQP